MDKRRVETLVQLANGIAHLGKQPLRQFNGRVALVHHVGKRFPRYAFHDHCILFANAVAIEDARKMQKARTLALRIQDAPIRSAKARFAIEIFANVRALLRAVMTDEEHALSALELAVFQHGINAIALVARQGIKLLLEFIIHN